MAKYVYLKSIIDREEAYVIIGLLQANGINARLDNSATMDVLPMHGYAIGGYKLMAPEGDLALASELLDAIETPKPEHDRPKQGLEYNGVVCAKCGGTHFKHQKSMFAPFFICLGVGVPLWWRTGRLRCTQCGTLTDKNPQPLEEQSQ